jgi:solute carrier family 35 (UDP-galactose transporter), member B1
LGGAHYTGRDYLFVALVVGGTILLTAGGESSSSSSSSSLQPLHNGVVPHNDDNNDDHRSGSVSWTAILCIVGSLAMDGITAGLQKRILQMNTGDGVMASPPPNAYDFLTFTNMAMVVIAIAASVVLSRDGLSDGVDYLRQNPRCASILWRCCVCSAIGQSFVFFIIATFDPLVLSTITTTRKILSVLLSIFLKGHLLTQQGVTGLGMALTGLLIEIQGKLSSRRRAAATSSSTTPASHKNKRLPGR